MKHRILVSLMVGLVSTLCCACSYADAVTLTVRVINSAGSPIENAPVEYGIGKSTKFGMTNAAGEVSSEIAIADGQRDANTRLWDGRTYTLTAEEKRLAMSRCAELTKSTYSDRLYTSAVPAGATSHLMTIQLADAVNVTVKFTNSRPTDDVLMLMMRDGVGCGAFVFAKDAVLQGVRKQSATHLVAVSDTQEVWIRALTAQETTQDVNLGSVQFPEPSCTAPVSLTMTNHTDLWASRIIQLRNMVTFVKKDDGRVFLASVSRTTNQTVLSARSMDPFKLPPGEYYVVPGVFGSDISWKVYDLVKGGHQALLDAAQIPKITAADGQTAEGTIDAKKVRDDIRAIPMP